MKFRFIVFGVIFLLGVLNAALVISDMPPCPEEGGLPGVPGKIQCPTPDDYDCDIDKERWEITGKQWIIQTSDGHHVASTEGAEYPKFPGHEEPTWKSFEADIIGETGALCGGRRYTPLSGYFRPDRSKNENDFVMQDKDDDCYGVGNCNWRFCGYLYGWILKDAEYENTRQPNFRCTFSSFEPTATNRIWVPCSMDEGG